MNQPERNGDADNKDNTLSILFVPSPFAFLGFFAADKKTHGFVWIGADFVFYLTRRDAESPSSTLNPQKPSRRDDRIEVPVRFDDGREGAAIHQRSSLGYPFGDCYRPDFFINLVYDARIEFTAAFDFHYAYRAARLDKQVDLASLPSPSCGGSVTSVRRGGGDERPF